MPHQTFAEWKKKENKVQVIWHDITDKLQGEKVWTYIYGGPFGIDLYCRPANKDWDERALGETARNHQDYDILSKIDEKGLTSEEANL